MNGKVTKLLKEFCLRYNKPYKTYAKRYKLLDSIGKKVVLDAIRKSLPIVN